MAKTNTQSGIKWAEPPAVTRGPQANPRYAEFADALRANPGQWAVFKDNAKDSQNVTDINKGHMQAFTPAGEFQATGRRGEDEVVVDEDGNEVYRPRYVIYARYIGAGGIYAEDGYSDDAVEG